MKHLEPSTLVVLVVGAFAAGAAGTSLAAPNPVKVGSIHTVVPGL